MPQLESIRLQEMLLCLKVERIRIGSIIQVDDLAAVLRNGCPVCKLQYQTA